MEPPAAHPRTIMGALKLILLVCLGVAVWFVAALAFVWVLEQIFGHFIKT